MITSLKNRQVSAAARLKKRGLRQQHGRFLAEGAQAVGEAVTAGAAESLFHVPGSGGRVPEVVTAAGERGVRTVAVSEGVMAHLTSTVTPQGIVAVSRFVDVGVAELPGDPGVVPVLCSVRDPGNAGTILRTADAAGAGAVVFTPDSVDVYNPKTVRASAGSLFHLPVVRESSAADAVEALRHRGAQVLAAAADGERSVYEVDLSLPTALLFGNEAWGLPPDVRDLADGSVRVPIRGRAESLNLAAAAAVALFESARQRSTPRPRLAELIAEGGHDVRLPLTAFTGFAATLAERWGELPESRRRELVASMRLHAERVAATMSLIVDAAGLEASHAPAAVTAQDLGEAARWVADLYGTSPDVPEVRVSGNAAVSVQRNRLRTLLLAIADAALWWGAGPLEIHVRAGDGKAVVEIRRSGDGPTEEEAAASLAGRDDVRFGLVAARLVAEGMGGSVSLDGGAGVRIRLALPT